MPFCENCGTELEIGSRFCTNCGSPVEATEAEVVEEAAAEAAEQEACLAHESADEIAAVAAAAEAAPKSKKKGKKKFAIIGGLVALVAIFGILLGTKAICFHDWCDATYSMPKTCVKCGRTDGFKNSAPEMEWPSSSLGKHLPITDVEYGKVITEYDESIHVKIYRASMNDYQEYVDACKKAGFTADEYEYDGSSADKHGAHFSADDADGYHISISYGGDAFDFESLSMQDKKRRFNDLEIIDITLNAPRRSNPKAEPEPEPEPAPEPKADSSSSSSSSSSGLRKDFKKAMDDYEAFVDDYCAFMKKYAKNPTDTSLLNDYNKMIQKELDMTASFEKWESEDLNDAEMAYYLEVQGRTSQKLLDAAASLY